MFGRGEGRIIVEVEMRFKLSVSRAFVCLFYEDLQTILELYRLIYTMGNETSSPSLVGDSEPTQILSSRNISAIAEYISNHHDAQIAVLTGAGISTSAGIPDFRSPDTGLYANLARLDLPYPEAVFDISYFRERPEPFYVLAKELYPGNFYPTISHAFIALLEKKGRLLKCFTQNIDCLERRAGVSGDKIVEAHGSFAKSHCVECFTEFPSDEMYETVMRGEVPHCQVPQCNGLVKPDIVFFGEQLPAKFFGAMGILAEANLLLVMGTSLSVQPFASLPQRVSEATPRLLINKERVGDLGTRVDDVILQEECDVGILKLSELLGWTDELQALYREVGGVEEKEEQARREEVRRERLSNDQKLEEEVTRLTEGIEKTLNFAKEHEERVLKELDEQGTTLSGSEKEEKCNPENTSKGAHCRSEIENSTKPLHNDEKPLSLEVESQPQSKGSLESTARSLDVAKDLTKEEMKS